MTNAERYALDHWRASVRTLTTYSPSENAKQARAARRLLVERRNAEPSDHFIIYALDAFTDRFPFAPRGQIAKIARILRGTEPERRAKKEA